MRKTIALILCVGALLPTSVFAMTGTVLDAHKYAWGNNNGYINFEDVVIDDDALSGYAWSTNYSWIKFNPAQGGVMNDGAGNLSGSAWGEQLGWVDFDGVTISANGIFSGTATGTIAGTITFDCPNYCDVETDWRPATVPETPSENTGGGPGDVNHPRISEPNIFPEDPMLSPHARDTDIVRDGVIDILDFNAMMVNWGSIRCGNIADMDADCRVGILDFNLLMVYWGIRYTL